MNTDVYQISGSKIEVDIEGRKVRVAYNPETNYALVPASVYASEDIAMQVLRDSDLVDGIFNHECITELDC